MALQRVGDANMRLLLTEMKKWSRGNWLEKRAAAAALCEPRLLEDSKVAARVLAHLDAMTASIADAEDRKNDAFVAFKKGLGYCWSVAVVALPQEGKALMEKWFASADPDIQWIMRENLSKNRLARMDAAWVSRSRMRLKGQGRRSSK